MKLNTKSSTDDNLDEISEKVYNECLNYNLGGKEEGAISANF